MKVPGQTLKGGVISQRLEKVNFCLVPGWAERVRGDESIEKLHPASQSERTVSPQRHQASRLGQRKMRPPAAPQRPGTSATPNGSRRQGRQREPCPYSDFMLGRVLGGGWLGSWHLPLGLLYSHTMTSLTNCWHQRWVCRSPHQAIFWYQQGILQVNWIQILQIKGLVPWTEEPGGLLTYLLCCCSIDKCPPLWDLMDCSMPGSSVLHSLQEFAQIHVL